MSTPGRDEGRAPPQQEPGDGHEAARRAVLLKIGRFAYAAPALALLAQPRRAQAGYGSGGGGTKPGNGFGDKNHTHTGPPGQNKTPPGQGKVK